MALEVHSYDGALLSQKDKLVKLSTIEKMSMEEKMNAVLEIKKKLTVKGISPSGMANLHSIISHIGCSPNYDPTNKVRAEDLLIYLGDFIDTEDYAVLINTQLEEISLGPCPQGRCTRLFQIAMSTVR